MIKFKVYEDEADEANIEKDLRSCRRNVERQRIKTNIKTQRENTNTKTKYKHKDKPRAGSEELPAVLSRPPEKPPPLSKLDLFLRSLAF